MKVEQTALFKDSYERFPPATEVQPVCIKHLLNVFPQNGSKGSYTSTFSNQPFGTFIQSLNQLETRSSSQLHIDWTGGRSRVEQRIQERWTKLSNIVSSSANISGCAYANICFAHAVFMQNTEFFVVGIRFEALVVLFTEGSFGEENRKRF